MKTLSHVQLFETPWTAAYLAPPSMGFSDQEYWSGLPLVILEGVIKFFKLAFVCFCHSLKLVSSFTELGSEICRDFFFFTKFSSGASLVVQWLKIHLATRGTLVPSPIQEDPTRHWTANSSSHNCCPECLQSMPCSKGTHSNKKSTHCNEA